MAEVQILQLIVYIGFGQIASVRMLGVLRKRASDKLKASVFG